MELRGLFLGSRSFVSKKSGERFFVARIDSGSDTLEFFVDEELLGAVEPRTEVVCEVSLYSRQGGGIGVGLEAMRPASTPALKAAK